MGGVGLGLGGRWVWLRRSCGHAPAPHALASALSPAEPRSLLKGHGKERQECEPMEKATGSLAGERTGALEL